MNILWNRTSFFVVGTPFIFLSEFFQKYVVLNLCDLGSHILRKRVKLLLQLHLAPVHTCSWYSIFKFGCFFFFEAIFHGWFLILNKFIFIFWFEPQKQVISWENLGQLLRFGRKNRKSPLILRFFISEFMDFYHRNAFFLDFGFVVVIDEWSLWWEIFDVFFLGIRHFWKIEVSAADGQPRVTYENRAFLCFFK